MRLLFLRIMMANFMVSSCPAMFQASDLLETDELHPSIAMHADVPHDLLRISGGSGAYQKSTARELEEQRPLVSQRRGCSSKTCMAIASCASFFIPFGIVAIIIYFH